MLIPRTPDPGGVGRGSPFASSVSAARPAFEKQHPNAGGSFTESGETVTIVGVPFFDFMHGQTGVAPNGIELHAILSVCFGKDCAGSSGNPDFSLAASAASVTGAGGATISASPSGGFAGS